MARQGMMPADHPRRLDEHAEQQVAVVVPGRRDRDDGAQQLFVDAGRVLMLWGWGALAAASTAGQRNDRPGYSSAVHAFLGLLLWLIGVSLVALVPVARAFPRAARLGAAVANAVIHCFFAPWN